MDVSIIDIISIFSGLVSIVLAVVAIWFSISTSRESRDNYEKTKEVLAKIDEKAAVVETTVTTAQKQLLDTVTKILEETAIPQKPDPGEEMGKVLLQMMAQDPKSMENIMKFMGPFMQQNQEKNNE